MGSLASVFYLFIFVLTGFLLTRLLAPKLSLEGTLVLSGALALSLVELLPALFALVLGFHLSAALGALAVSVLIGILCVLKLRKQKSAPALQSSGASFWFCVLPLLAVTVGLLFTHTLWLRDGAYWCGQSTYGDLPMHLAFIESIPQQESFPPHYLLLAGQQDFGYPFLCETVSSVFLVLGAGLKFACLLPQSLAVFTVLGGGWWLGKELLGSNTKASLGYWLFFLGSGFGFAYFLGGGRENFTRIFTEFYETPTNYVQENIRWVNPIADLLIPQRATLFGWALLLPCLALLARFALQQGHSLWPLLSLAAAPLPLVHTHSALALVMVSAVLFVHVLFQHPTFKSVKPWLLWAAFTGACWIPQLFGVIFRQTSSGNGFLRFQFNWANEGDNYFWFYIKNIGLVYLLLIPAFLWADKKLRWFYGGGLFILLVSEFIVFQPNAYDNNKLLFIWHLLGCLLVANFLVDLAGYIPKKSVTVCLAALVLTVCTIGSVLTLGREANSKYMQFSADSIAAGEFAKAETPADARFLTGRQHLNPVASLAGRDILCGSNLYVHFHGMDYNRQSEAVRQLYETPSRELLSEWGIDYVMISSWERSDYALNEDWFRQNCTPVFEQGEFLICKV